MGQIHKFLIIIIVFAVLLSGCSKTDEKKDNAATETKMEATTEIKKENSDTNFFPSSYTGGTEKVKFDCILEIPDRFDPFNFYLPKVNGLQCVDQDAAFKVGVGEQEIKDQIMYPKDADHIADEYIYFLSDDTTIYVDTGFSIWNDIASCYSRTAPLSEQGASQESFAFGAAEDCIDEIKRTLSAMSYPVDELQFYWFSVNKNEYQELEQEYLENGMIEADKTKGEWTDEDNVYEIYAWQMYGGLPVLPRYMTIHMGSAFDNYQRALLSAKYSVKGLLSLNAAAPYKFEATENKASFLKFSEIVSAVEQKYDNLLDDGSIYTVYRAKLAVRVYYDENQQYAAEPVWYFEVVDDNENVTVLLVNALSGKEIYLNP